MVQRFFNYNFFEGWIVDNDGWIMNKSCTKNEFS
jgi:hypothetical protein